MNLKLGRLPAIHDGRALYASKYMTAAQLPPAPSFLDWSSVITKLGVAWGMDGNDTVGDCTVAALNHIMMVTSATAGKLVQASLAQIMAMYEAISGYVPGDPNTDVGATEVSALNYMRKHGLNGQKVDAYASLNIALRSELLVACNLFGPIYIGVWLSQTDMDDFEAGKGWTDVSDTNSIGGHAIPIVAYDSSGVEVVTWGRKQAASWHWLMAHMDEAHALILFDWLDKQGVSPGGFNRHQLEVDLKMVTQ